MLPFTLKKAHEATVKSFKTSKLRLFSRHDCRAFKPVTHAAGPGVSDGT